MDTVTVRHLRERDRPAFKRLLKRAWAEYPSPPVERSIDNACWAETLAFIGRRLVGFGVMQVVRDSTDPFDSDLLSELYVLPEHRRRGVGTAIMDHLTQRSICGVITAWWPVVGEARHFLRKNGWYTSEPSGIIFPTDVMQYVLMSEETLARWKRQNVDRTHVLEQQARRRREWEAEQEKRRRGHGTPGDVSGGQTRNIPITCNGGRA